MTFEELGLKEGILAAVSNMGFINPTPIQEKAIPYLLENQGDLIGLASTGTGKTAAFGLPLLNQIETDIKNTQGLIVCPTRELCIQITKDLNQFASGIKGINIVPVYGGTDIVKQIRQIEKGAQVIVATPGRLIDLINRKKVKLRNVDVVILDEADEMLNMGFKEDIDSILEQTPNEKSVWLFSATMPKEVANIARNYMENPFEITVGGKNETNKNIEHDYYIVKERDRYSALKRLIDSSPDIYGLIFCRTRRDTAAVADKLMADGYSAEPLHGELSQAQRDRVMDKFRRKTLQILVATDVAARGIDVDNITHVIHYQLPEDVENYTHRSGRTARAGKKGISIALINTREGGRIKSIERIIKTSFNRKDIPAADKICEIQLYHLIDKMTDVEVNTKAIEKYMPQVNERLEHLSKEDIVQRFVSAEFNRFLQYYENSKNLNATASDRGDDRDYGDRSRRRSKKREDDPNSQRFFVNLGRKDGFNHGALLRLICDNTSVSKNSVGKIDVMNNFSFFDANKNDVDEIVKRMQNIDFEGKKMNVEQTNKGGGDSSSKKSPRRSGSGYGSKEGSYSKGNRRENKSKRRYRN